MSDRIGIDTGGTFTDFVWLDESGELKIYKELSTPKDPSVSVLRGIKVMKVAASTSVIHGSTVATNALLERKGARTALITTAGFGDVLAIGRQNRPELYSLVPQKPEPLVPKKWRFEIIERITSEGEVLIPLELSQVSSIFSRICDDNIESVAICLLFSFLRPEHEQLIRSEIRKQHDEMRLRNQKAGYANFHISLSCEVLPEFREYERTSTTVINAYVTPIMGRYLRQMSKGISPRKLSVMQSNGGIASVETGATLAARTVLSGPAGGVVGARYVASSAGFENIITFDMGGTSTDVALCAQQLPLTSEGVIDAMPLRTPMIDIHTVGAGGGSLARIDAAGALLVGPQSAGANPGPACYPRERPFLKGLDELRATTTDANLVLGRLDSENFLGGSMTLDLSAGRQAVAEVARFIGRASIEATALDIIQVANATMERAVRRISVERGYDPRHFTMVAFGGAGPLHACDLAAALLIPRVLIPTMPGVLSALGMLAAPPTKDFSQTIMVKIEEGDSDEMIGLEGLFGNLEELALEAMAKEGYSPHALSIKRSFDMRYAGQSFELRVGIVDDARISSIVSSFHDAHFQRYGYKQEDAQVEIVNIRVTAVADFEPPPIPKIGEGNTDPSPAVIGDKEVWFGAVPLKTPLYLRSLLMAGNIIDGPGVIFQYDTTTIIPPKWQAAVDERGNLIISYTISTEEGDK